MDSNVKKVFPKTSFDTQILPILNLFSHSAMRGIHIFEKPYYREIRTMRGRIMREPPVVLEWYLVLA